MQKTADWLRLKACFGAGTPIRTPGGWINIEETREGDMVLSRDEHEPMGLVESKRVEELFVRTAPILKLQINGQEIKTTAEHPFYAFEKGWTNAGELTADDQLLDIGGRWHPVQAVVDTGEWTTVYNFRVQDHHTYFVGDDDWGWIAWAHNPCALYVAPDGSNLGSFAIYKSSIGTLWLDNTNTAISEPSAVAAVNTFKSKGGLGTPKNVASIQDWSTHFGTTNKGNGVGDFAASNLAYSQFRTANPDFLTNPPPPTSIGRTEGKALTGNSNWPNTSGSVDNITTHAHHIVVRKGTGAETEIRKSHQILRTVGIDPYFGQENFAWAPNWWGHGNRLAYPIEVYNRLLSLGIPIENNPTDTSVSALAARQAEVVTKLNEIAKEFFEATISMM